MSYYDPWDPRYDPNQDPNNPDGYYDRHTMPSPYYLPPDPNDPSTWDPTVTPPQNPLPPGEEPPPGTGATPPPPPAGGADPWAIAPTDGNWQAWFLRNVQGLQANPSSLAGLESKLTPHGIKVLRNAAGVAGKIQLPDGRIVDVGRGFSGQDPGYMAWVWQEGEGGEDPNAGIPTEPINPEYLTPFTEAQPDRPTLPGYRSE